MRTFSDWVLDRFSLELQPLREVYLNKIGTWNSYEKEGSELGAQTLGRDRIVRSVYWAL